MLHAVHAALVLRLLALTPLANSLLNIPALTVGFTPSGWLFCYANLFLFLMAISLSIYAFLLTSTFTGTQLGRKTNAKCILLPLLQTLQHPCLKVLTFSTTAFHLTRSWMRFVKLFLP